MRRIIILFISIIVFITTAAALTSCYDAREISDLSYVTAVGVDRGVSDKWRLTMQLRSMSGEGNGSESGGGGGAGKSKYTTMTIEAPAFISAVELANTSLPRKVTFIHTRLLVFSEDFAKSGLLGEFIAPIVRFREFRRSMNIVVSKEPAEEFINNLKPTIGNTVVRDIEELLKQTEETGYLPSVTLYELYNGLKSAYRQPIAIAGAVNKGENFSEKGELWGNKFNISGDYYAGDVVKKGGNNIELLGCIVSDGDKMVGKLTGYETRMMMIVRGIFQKGTLVLRDPKKPELVFGALLKEVSHPKIKVGFEGEKPLIDLKINMHGDITAIQSRVNYESPEMLPILEKEVEKSLEEGIRRTIDKCKALDSDVFFFGTYAVRHFGTIEEWEKYNWNKHFKDAQVNVDVKFKIRRTGTQIMSAPIISKEGTE
ncbi:Ger(x)C family spore germination protein [Pseudobacteroides cellulosolvens]|uniref:Germination protein, Ger(X)C family n=1 Tax=Pseudobacteroides cellulosolvens ATCC 35603 = DSM 2933 TaxID=398512 RepID=A0A0L6JTT2_9FIRM|nr:Ger(x)C family spore germination protein [Pseudobacteroides cellulosolvens]KNY28827.1 germination protein, Ger(x)C family [Pseudobacteroides cellulosolvens ATCC 35603 = DSM 2933]